MAEGCLIALLIAVWLLINYPGATLAVVLVLLAIPLLASIPEFLRDAGLRQEEAEAAKLSAAAEAKRRADEEVKRSAEAEAARQADEEAKRRALADEAAAQRHAEELADSVALESLRTDELRLVVRYVPEKASAAQATLKARDAAAMARQRANAEARQRALETARREAAAARLEEQAAEARRRAEIETQRQRTAAANRARALELVRVKEFGGMTLDELRLVIAHVPEHRAAAERAREQLRSKIWGGADSWDYDQIH